MADKPRNPRNGGPGGRQAGPGRLAGKPATGPARASRNVGGVDRYALEKLADEGMLSAEGRKLLGGDAPARQRGLKPAVRGPVKLGAVPVISTRGPEAMEEAIREIRPGRNPRTEAPRTAVRAERKGGKVKGPRPDEAPAERLHKVMAQSGVASRRHSEELIQAGRVTVNGQVVTELGIKVVPGRDRVEVDGRPLGQKEDLVYILLNKPKGYVTTLYDPQGRPKVTDLLGGDIGARIYPVGRLDYDTEGLLLLTNDGDLANALMHPAREIKKTYIAKVRGVPGPAKIRELESGIELDDGPTAPAEVKLIEAKGPNAATLSIRIHEGRNRQVRRMFEAVGHEMIHLKRTTLGPLSLRDMQVGQWRELSEREIDDLKRSLGLRVMNRGAKVAAIGEQRKAGRRGAARFERPEAGRFGGRTGGGMPVAEAGFEAKAAPTVRGGRPAAGAGRPLPKVGGRPVRAKGPRPAEVTFEPAAPRTGGPRQGGGFGDRPRTGGGPREGGRGGAGPREGARGGAGFGGGPREGGRGGAGFGGGPREGGRGGAGFGGGPREGGRGGGGPREGARGGAGGGGPRKGGADFGFGDRSRTGGGPRDGARGGAGFGGGPRKGAGRDGGGRGDRGGKRR
jgi:23S rRNA pseudouridine2605 synthase